MAPASRTARRASGRPSPTLGSDAKYALRASNTDIEARDLGLPAGSPARDAALDWLHGAPMGDPLHSKSVSVDYGARQVVYVMTNQGLLHAIDATSPGPGDVGARTGGEEIFAFMPRGLLSNLPALAAGKTGPDHVYGLDGAITRWHDDADGDGVVDAGESLLLVFGMRRGGDAYHALDVSDPEAPRLAWTLDASSGFPDLAQTRSRAALVDVGRGDGGRERVLVFGGGYDAARLDGGDKRRRADGSSLLADLYSPAAPHPFFSAPSVALNLGPGAPWLSVSLGSGDRTAPLGKGTANALFVLKDVDDATGAPPSFAGTIGTTALHDATDDAPTVAPAALAAGLADERGWQLRLAPSEKSLSCLVSFDGQLMATTYEADGGPGGEPCSIAETQRPWTLDIGTARADGPGGDDGTLVRSRELGGSGIPSAVQNVFSADSDEVGSYVGIGQEKEENVALRRVYWHAR